MVQEQKHLPVSGPRHSILAGSVMNYLELLGLLLESLESSEVTQGKENRGARDKTQRSLSLDSHGWACSGTGTTVGLVPFFLWFSTPRSLLVLLTKDALSQPSAPSSRAWGLWQYFGPLAHPFWVLF